MKNRAGITVLELLSAISIGMLLITFSYSAIHSFMTRMEMSAALSTITSGLSEARYLSVSRGRKIRFNIADHSIYLQVKQNSGWESIRSYRIKGKTKINSNSSPVFNPRGSASPLCSIKISNKMYSYVVSLSFAGRIRLRKM